MSQPGKDYVYIIAAWYGNALYYNRLSISLTLKAAVVSHPAMSNSVSPLLTQHLPYIMRALKAQLFSNLCLSTAWTQHPDPKHPPTPTVMEIFKNTVPLLCWWFFTTTSLVCLSRSFSPGNRSG